MACGSGSCRVGRGLDLVLLWLWHRLAATALIWPLAKELPYVSGAPLKRPKKKNSLASGMPVPCRTADPPPLNPQHRWALEGGPHQHFLELVRNANSPPHLQMQKLGGRAHLSFNKPSWSPHTPIKSENHCLIGLKSYCTPYPPPIWQPVQGYTWAFL